MRLLLATLIALMGMGETTPAAGQSPLTASAARGANRTATSPSAVPYDCKRFPPPTRKWLRYGYSICMNGPGWQKVRVRCYHPQAGKVYIVYGFYARSHQTDPDNDLSIQWCPPGSYARRVRILKLPEIGFAA